MGINQGLISGGGFFYRNQAAPLFLGIGIFYAFCRLVAMNEKEALHHNK